MADLKHDPIINAIQKGVKDDIEFNHSNGRYRAALILILAAVDAMAFLNMPGSQLDVTGKDFETWAERYIKFPGVTQLRGVELYGARCALLHTYSSESKLSRAGKCRQLMFVDDIKHGSPLRDSGHPKFILVSIAGLKDALFKGIDSFLVDVFSSTDKTRTIEKRLPKLLIAREDVPGTSPQLRSFLESP